MSSTVKTKILTQESLLNKYLETKDKLDENVNAELEVRFGTRNVSKITKNTFDNTIQYLLSKNFNFLDSGSYYLSIKADDIRVEIDNIVNIQNYCKTNSIPEDPQVGYLFTEKSTYMIDDKVPARFNLDNFNFRITYSTEKKLQPSSIEVENLIKEWPSKSKFNRLINRFSYG